MDVSYGDTGVQVGPGITITAARTASRDIRRHKASSYDRHPAAADGTLTGRAAGCRL